MEFGVVMFATEYAMRIEALACACEERGFESLWVPEHTHIPASRKSPWPGGAELPKMYWHTLDPFVSLMAAAAATRTLKIGTGICLVIERDTITTAKEVATLDLLSEGRLMFGVGAGWNVEEMENHGTDFKTRFKRMREQVLAMQTIWTEDEPEYHGRFVDFDPIWSYPKPVQKPYPPVHLGGSGPHTIKRVIEFCDGWIPIGRSPDELIAGVGELCEAAAQSDRDMGTIELTVFGCPPDADVIERYKEAGFTRIIFSLPSEGAEENLPRLDKCAKFVS